MRDESLNLIDKCVAHLESMGAANHEIRFDTLVSYLSLQVERKGVLYRDPFYLTAIAYIAWHTASCGKLEL
jgi:hypothetical protein